MLTNKKQIEKNSVDNRNITCHFCVLKPQRPFGSISGILVFLVCWFEETLRGAKWLSNKC